MTPAKVSKEEQPPKGSGIVLILIVLLLVFGIGALYFRLTGSIL
jgi:flagellar basal body-associated protein FliL